MPVVVGAMEMSGGVGSERVDARLRDMGGDVMELLRGCGRGSAMFGGFWMELKVFPAECEAMTLEDILGVVMGGGAGGEDLGVGDNTLGSGRGKVDVEGREELIGNAEVFVLGCEGMARVGGGSFDSSGRGAGKGIVDSDDEGTLGVTAGDDDVGTEGVSGSLFVVDRGFVSGVGDGNYRTRNKMRAGKAQYNAIVGKTTRSVTSNFAMSPLPDQAIPSKTI